MGFFNAWFVDDWEKKFRMNILDNRIHFALNCGAQGCPPVLFYEAKNIEKQLELATRSFLKKEVQFKPDENKVYVSKIFYWYKGDFGGKSGILKFLKKYNKVPEKAKPSIVFREYDWTLLVGHFGPTEEEEQKKEKQAPPQ